MTGTTLAMQDLNNHSLKAVYPSTIELITELEICHTIP